MPLLDVQRRGQQIGRIRIGQQVATASGGTRPAKLDTFRFTTQSRPSADAIAELFGGEVREWRSEWEVITRESAIGVTVPPRDQVVSQWYEMWTKGGCQRRCDSQTEQISGRPCLCPHAGDPGDEDEVARCALERANLAKENPPRACKAVTRISVMIPDLPGLGVFRLDTGSYYAAVEIGDAAALMELARGKGFFLPAILRIEQRSRVANGQTKKYPVPVLEVLATFRDITSGALEAGGIRAQLPPAPGQPKAITAAPSPVAARPVPASEPPSEGDRLIDEDTRRYRLAQDIADRARITQGSGEFRSLIAEMKQHKLEEEFVCEEDDRENGVNSQLEGFLRDLWQKRAKEGAR